MNKVVCPRLHSLDVLLTYLAEAVILLTLGIILGNILVETGIFGRLTRLTRPLGGISGLSEESTTAILGKNEKILYRADFLPHHHDDEKKHCKDGSDRNSCFRCRGHRYRHNGGDYTAIRGL